MTGVAANRCENTDDNFRLQIEREMPYVKWGLRYSVLGDISPIATLIAGNYTADVDIEQFEKDANEVLKSTAAECEWMFQTLPEKKENSLLENEIKGTINYTVWSDVFLCPQCSQEFVFSEAASDPETGEVADVFLCPHCGASLKKKDCSNAFDTRFDSKLNKSIKIAKQKPVLINYSFAGKRYSKTPDANDIATIQKVENMDIPYWYPTDRMCEGKEARRNDKIGLTNVHYYFYKRTLYVLAKMYFEILSRKTSKLLRIFFTSQIINISKMNRYRPQVSFPYNPLSGTFYVSSMVCEANPFNAYRGKIKKFISALQKNHKDGCLITCSSTTNLCAPENSVDYIFTDPPFGDNLNYSELSFLWESWIKVKTNNLTEAIIDKRMGKSLTDYQDLMTRCFTEYYRVLKPNRWITVEFHNSKNYVWNAIQEALQKAGFIIADVRTLDKQGRSFKQINAAGAVKQDLVISAYKPQKSFVKTFMAEAGNEEQVWEFVHQYLEKLPIAPDGDHDGKIDIVPERQNYLLYDRMIAWHLLNGVAIPMEATEFYQGLDDHFLKRDDMYFLPDQVNEYDQKRSVMELENVEMAFAIQDEKGAIQWLNYQLTAPQTYQDLQPKYLQELHQLRSEKMPELMDLLRENFLQDEEGKWYVPDITKAGDVAKLRQKSLLKEFESYLQMKGKLKVFRSEAIRAGFDKLWKEQDYKTIVSVAERLPEKTIQEDANLLMYYDLSTSRV